MNKDTLGGRIRHLRTEHGLSQEELAHRVTGASRAQICRFETGTRSPSPEVLAQLAVVLGTTDTYLISGTDAPEPLEELSGRRDTFRIHSRPKGRTTIQVYPSTSATLRALSQKHGLTCPELVDQMLTFCLQRMDE